METRKRRVEEARRAVPFPEVRRAAEGMRNQPHSLLRRMKRDAEINIIAEFKRRSPSRGEINSIATPSEMARAYEKGGAAAVSVLTEEDFFGGSLADLQAVRNASQLPVLRKDFIFDEYQVYESAAAGAAALLLIVAALDDQTLARLRQLTEDELKLDALVEVHTPKELERAINIGARLVGVNNRDLRTFNVSTQTSVELAGLAPADVVLISESGLSPVEVRRLRTVGYRGFLVGEALMTAEDAIASLQEFTSVSANTPKRVRVKICGITSLEDAQAAIAAGADMLGFNFYPSSPRYIAPEHARSIITAIRSQNMTTDPVMMIGVFVNEPADQLVRAAEIAGLDGIQLHGDDSIEFCATVKSRAPNLMLIKVFHVRDGFEAATVTDFPADAIMLDTFHPELRGGTGRSFDWTIAQGVAAVAPKMFLAGGLSPENVTKAVAAVRPYAIDACSSLESSPGRKDATLMKQFVRAAHAG